MSSLAFTVTVNVGTAVTGVEDGLFVGAALGDFEGFIEGLPGLVVEVGTPASAVGGLEGEIDWTIDGQIIGSFVG
jgi:hypothetical protein